MVAVRKRREARSAADDEPQAFLGVTQSARGFVWRERLTRENHNLALAISHPWLAPGLVVSISLLFAFFVWWLWRKLFRRAPGPQPG